MLKGLGLCTSLSIYASSDSHFSGGAARDESDQVPPVTFPVVRLGDQAEPLYGCVAAQTVTFPVVRLGDESERVQPVTFPVVRLRDVAEPTKGVSPTMHFG